MRRRTGTNANREAQRPRCGLAPLRAQAVVGLVVRRPEPDARRPERRVGASTKAGTGLRGRERPARQDQPAGRPSSGDGTGSASPRHGGPGPVRSREARFPQLVERPNPPLTRSTRVLVVGCDQSSLCSDGRHVAGVVRPHWHASSSTRTSQTTSRRAERRLRDRHRRHGCRPRSGVGRDALVGIVAGPLARESRRDPDLRRAGSPAVARPVFSEIIIPSRRRAPVASEGRRPGSGFARHFPAPKGSTRRLHQP